MRTEKERRSSTNIKFRNIASSSDIQRSSSGYFIAPVKNRPINNPLSNFSQASQCKTCSQSCKMRSDNQEVASGLEEGPLVRRCKYFWPEEIVHNRKYCKRIKNLSPLVVWRNNSKEYFFKNPDAQSRHSARNILQFRLDDV